jgi:hypothetical protein
MVVFAQTFMWKRGYAQSVCASFPNNVRRHESDLKITFMGNQFKCVLTVIIAWYKVTQLAFFYYGNKSPGQIKPNNATK